MKITQLQLHVHVNPTPPAGRQPRGFYWTSEVRGQLKRAERVYADPKAGRGGTVPRFRELQASFGEGEENETYLTCD